MIGSGPRFIALIKELLIAFRVFQGIGGGALLPIAFAIVYRIFPPMERPSHDDHRRADATGPCVWHDWGRLEHHV